MKVSFTDVYHSSQSLIILIKFVLLKQHFAHQAQHTPRKAFKMCLKKVSSFQKDIPRCKRCSNKENSVFSRQLLYQFRKFFLQSFRITHIILRDLFDKGFLCISNVNNWRLKQLSYFHNQMQQHGQASLACRDKLCKFHEKMLHKTFKSIQNY